MVIHIQVKEPIKRADIFIAEKLNLTRNKIQKLIEDNFIFLNNKPFKASTKLKIGDVISGTLPEPIQDESLNPYPMDIDILYEDSSIIVLNKPKGVVVHPAYGHKEDTLVNALIFHCKDLAGIGGVIRPGVVHRLDKDTSGILVFAKNERSYLNLQKQFKDRNVIKKYLALLLGIPKETEETVVTNIGRDPKNRKKFTVVKEGKEAITHYKILKSAYGVSIADINIKTGRTHQIRVHMNYIGIPIVGDEQYNKKKYNTHITNKELLQLCNSIKGQALCAYHMEFEHPLSKVPMSFTVKPPEDMQKIISWIEKNATN